MNNKLQKIILCWTFALLGSSVHSQILNKPSTDAKLTPSVTGNSSIGNIYSPNLFEGSTNINIPIYNYSTDAGGFGINLGYNTKGVKVDEPSGNVGLHWSLNAGGSITRVMKDVPDEIWDQRYLTNGMVQYYPVTGRMFWYDFTDQEKTDQVNHLIYGDGESDDFVVSAGGLNFTFNLGKGGYVFSHPHTNAKVRFLLNGQTVTRPTEDNLAASAYEQFSFEITDVQGNIYYFDKGTTDKKSFYDGRGNIEVSSITYISQWVLTKVKLASGSAITYNYQQKNLGSAPVYFSEIQSEHTDGLIMPSREAVIPVGNRPELDYIQYPNGIKAEFIYRTQTSPRCDNTGERILQEIKIGSGLTNCMRYRFNQVYAMSRGTTNGNNTELDITSPCATMSSLPSMDARLYHRLRLKGIDILSCDGSTTEPYYSFDYDPRPMPRRLYAGQDFFGYYNGQPVNESATYNSVPLHRSFTDGSLYGMNKSPNADSIKVGMLTSLRNAYGGKVSFEYEAHVLSGVNNGELPNDDGLFLGKGAADGLRLKSITESDRFYPGNYKRTSFSYADGQIFMNGGYFHYPVRVPHAGDPPNVYNVTNIYVSPHQLINGSNHGYSQVNARVTNQDNQLLSSEETTFTNFKDENGNTRSLINGGTKKFFEYPYTDKQYIRDWEIGLPVKEVSYDLNNMMVSERTNIYEQVTHSQEASTLVFNRKELRTVPAIWSTSNYVPYYVAASDTYIPYTGRSLLKSSTVKKYTTATEYVEDQVSYSYDERENLSTTTARNSKGEYTYVKNVFNYTVAGPNIPGPTGGILFDMTLGGLEKVVSTERWLKGTGTPGFSDELLDASITGYFYKSGQLTTQSLHTLMTGEPIGFTAYTGLTPGNLGNAYGRVISAYNGDPVAGFQKVSEVTHTDAKGNPLETKLMDQEQYKAMLWDTATGNKLADVSNAKYNEIGCSGFESNIPGMSYTGQEMITNGNFIYKQAGINNTSGKISGNWAYLLSSSPYLTTIKTANNLTADKDYLVTFWAKNGVPALSGAGVASVTFSAAAPPVNGWTFYQGRFRATAAGVMTFSSGTAVYLDELRLFPAEALMSSWTYDPMTGKTAATDASGRISYMEYDKLGRPAVSRDQEGHILQQTTYGVHQ